MRYKHSKTSPASTEWVWEKFWICSLGNTWNPSQGLQQNTNFNDWFQSSEPEVNQFSRRTPEGNERCIRICHSGDHRTIHICQNASPLEEINYSGPVPEWHMWANCVTSSKGVGTEWFESCRWAADQLQIHTVTQQPTQQNPEKPKPVCHHCKKTSHYRKQCSQVKREKGKAQANTNSAGNSNNNNGGQRNSNSVNQKDRKPRTVYPPWETCGKTNYSTKKCYLGANTDNRPPPRNRRPEGQNQVQQRNA